MEGSDKRYSILSDVISSITPQISALDLVYAHSLPLLMRSFGYLRPAKKVSSFAASMSKSASSQARIQDFEMGGEFL